MSDLVGNPEDRFSQNEAHIKPVNHAFSAQPGENLSDVFAAGKGAHQPMNQ